MTIALGLDIGTTGADAVAVDESGKVVGTGSATYPMSTPRPQWSEQSPQEWWRGAREALAQAGAEAMQGRDRVAGLGLTGQMHGSVFMDGSGEVIRPALLWNDQRTARQCEEITERVGQQRIVEITGNPALTGFQAPKVLWLREEEPEAYRLVTRILLPKDYIRYRLSGDFATEASDASGTLLLDLETRKWSGEVLEALDIPEDWLPPVYEGPETTGSLDGAVAAELGLPAGIPIAAGGGDNAAAAIGTGITREGVISSSIGTSGVLFAHAEERTVDPSGRIHAFCHAVPDRFCLLAVTLSAGGSLRWWRDVTGLGFHDLVVEAAGVPPGAEGLVFLPYLTGERTPHLDPEIRGAFVGLTARHTRAHMTRAVMEGVVFSLREGLEIIRALGIRPTEIRATGGGATAKLWLRLQADVYGRPIRRLAIEEGAAYGAALLGHIAAGTFRTVEEATAVVHTLEDVTEPDPGRADAYTSLFEVYRGLYGSLRDQTHSLGALART